MKKIILIPVLCFLFSSLAYAKVEKDGFDITILNSAVKSFNISDIKVENFIKYVSSNFNKNSSGSWSSGEMYNEEVVYLDKSGNSIKIATEKNTNTGAGTTTITIVGPVGFVDPLRAMLK